MTKVIGVSLREGGAAQIICLCFILWLAPVASAVPINIIVVAGQSNIGGTIQAKNMPEGLGSPQEDILYYYNTNDVLSDGWETLGPNAFNNRYGPEHLLMHNVSLAYPSDQWAVLKVNNGGTNLRVNWNPFLTDGTNDQWQALMAARDDSFALLNDMGFEPNVVGFVWGQGEGDAGFPKTAVNYEPLLTTFIAAVRSEFNALDMPFIFNKLHKDSDREYAQQLRRSQERVNAYVDNTFLVPVDDLALGADSVHFTQTSRIELGYRFASAFFHQTALSGDANLDGTVSIEDYDILLANFGQSGRWAHGDFNADGLVDRADFLALRRNFGESQPLTIPEPSSLAVLLILLPLLVRPGARHMKQLSFRR